MTVVELHTDDEELLFVQQGPVIVSLQEARELPSYLDAYKADICSLVRVISADGEVIEQETYPLFFEARDYQLFINMETDFAAEHTVRFWHENARLRDRIKPRARKAGMLSGVLNFQNEVGYSDLVIQLDEVEYLRITIEVFPSKLDYKEDYLALMTDVTSEIYNLAFDLLRKTYRGFELTGSTKPTLIEFFAIIRTIYGDFCRATDAVIRQPHHVLQTTHQVMPAHKARRLDGASRKWLESHPQSVVRGMDGTIAATHINAVKRQVTYDTKENRFVVFALERVMRRLRAFREEYVRIVGAKADSDVLHEIDAMASGLYRRRQFTFLAEIEPESNSASSSLVFAMAPGYRELYGCYLKILRGLSVVSGTFNLSTKDLAELYEYWCFIKLNSLLKDKYQLVGRGIVSADYGGLSVKLKHGTPSKITYKNPVTHEQIILSYNPTYAEGATGAQRPDNVLSLKKNGSEVRYEYIFDAKYRINQALPGSEYAKNVDVNPGPEVDTINAMHRYRDAIVSRKDERVERTMFGAYVLFPYKNEELYTQHRFYRSIQQVNIGGLPFLPSATSMVEALLDELIGDSPASASERSLPAEGVAGEEWDAAQRQDWSKRDVLVGGLRNAMQFDACFKGKFYYIPESMLHQDDLPIHWVALYQSKRHFGVDQAGVAWYGEVIGCRHVSRGQISEVPCETGRESEPYWRFQVREWKQLDERIAVRERGVQAALLTNEFLLTHAIEVPDLMVESPEEWRVYSELRRMVADIESIEAPEAALAYVLGDRDVEVVMSGGIVTALGGGQEVHSVELSEFKKAPRREWLSLRAALGM